jgi:putative exosortase-associated protein (TIGR04073 family)
MKKSLRVLAAFFILFAFTLPVFSEEAEIQAEGTPQRKLQRGFLNVALSPIEISHELSKEVRKDIFPPSWVAGLGRGAVYTVGRALVGVYEMVTFPFPYPANYKPILQPEFTWQELPEGKS